MTHVTATFAVCQKSGTESTISPRRLPAQSSQICLVWEALWTLQKFKIHGSSVHGDSPGKNSGVGCHALLQGIFPTQGLNLGLLHCRWFLYHLSHQGSPPYMPSWNFFVNSFVQKCLWDSFTLLHKSRIRSFSWLHEIPSLVQQVLVTHYLDDHLYFSQFGATMSKVVMNILTHVSQCIHVLPSLMHDWIKRLYSFSTSPDNDNTLKN